MSSNNDTMKSCFDNHTNTWSDTRGTEVSFFDKMKHPPSTDTVPFFGAIEDVEEIDEEKEHNEWINSEIDLRYQNGEFKERPLHAALSRHKYYYAGEAIVRFFTDDTINQISIGSSSGDMRNHTIFKCRERNMVFEVHCGHGDCDIFPLYGILDYLEEYSPVFPKREEWMNLSNNLPNYDMVPLPKI